MKKINLKLRKKFTKEDIDALAVGFYKVEIAINDALHAAEKSLLTHEQVKLYQLSETFKVSRLALETHLAKLGCHHSLSVAELKKLS
jgi:hypothetical protein